MTVGLVGTAMEVDDGRTTRERLVRPSNERAWLANLTGKDI